VWQGACKALDVRHGRFDTFGGDCPAALDQSLWRALIREPPDASRVDKDSKCLTRIKKTDEHINGNEPQKLVTNGSSKTALASTVAVTCN
jgi:hypothetical protein